MKKVILLFGTLVSVLMSVQCASDTKNSFPLLSEKTQKAIVTDLSSALNDLAQASRPVGGDSETYWAASVVDSLHKVVTGDDRPFIEQIATIHHMNSYFAYGMNYFPSVIGMYSCPDEASYARNSVSVCDSLANNVKATGYNDMLAVADLATHSYFYTQLYVTMLYKINGNEDFVDKDLGFPFHSLRLLRYADEKKVFTPDEMTKIYFVLDAVCFFKTYFGYVMTFTYGEEKQQSTQSKLIEYANYIDEVSGPVFEAIYADEYKGLGMTDQAFEDFMIRLKDIKVDMLKRLTEEFIDGAKRQ